MISIITPVRNCAHLIPAYEAAVREAEVTIIDNASEPEQAVAWSAMVQRLGGNYIRNDENRYFAPANEQGRAVATGDVLLFLNNDIVAQEGWLAAIARDVQDAMLAGPSVGVRMVDGQPLVYIEGWCIAGRRATWEQIGGWDAEHYTLPYWDDNDVCFRAARAGIRLCRRAWNIHHLGGQTTRGTPEAQQAVQTNGEVFKRQVRAARS